MKDFLIALMPLAIGLSAIAMLMGWISINPRDPQFSAAWRKKNRTKLIACGILSTLGGICCFLQLFGVLDALRPQ